MYKENRFAFLCEQTVQDGSVGSSYSLLDSASSFIFCSCMRLRVEPTRQKEKTESYINNSNHYTTGTISHKPGD